MERRGKISEYLAFGFVLILAELTAFSHLRLSIELSAVNGRDWQIHLINMFKVYHCHFDFGKILLWYKHTTSTILHYPPFNYLISVALWEFLKLPPLAAAYASKAVWIFFSALAMYGVGRLLGGDGWAGIAAAILGILNGLILDQAQEVSLETVVPAALALVIYGYALSRGYQRLFGSVVLGIALGIGLLTKSVLFIFAAPFLVFALFFNPFEKESPLIKRLACAAFAASIAVSIASLYYFTFFKEFLAEAGSESAAYKFRENLSNVLSYPFPFVISPFMLILALVSIVLQLRKKDFSFIPPFATLIISSAYMTTLQTLGCTYFFPFRILFTLIIVRGMKYLKSAYRFVLAFLLVIIFYVPLLINKPLIKNDPINRFFYPFDKWANYIEIVPRDIQNHIWEIVDRFACLFKNRYSEYGYKDIGYVIASDMIHIPNMALALVKGNEAWLEDLDWNTVINVSLAGNDYNEPEMQTIRSKKLVIFTLPEKATGKPYQFLRDIYDTSLKDERVVDFSFPVTWGFGLPGEFKVLMLTKRLSQ